MYQQETYVEQVVNKVATKQEGTIKNILLVLTIFFGMTSIFGVHFICPILFIISVIAYYVQLGRIDSDYEYLYVAGSLEIDRISRQSKRKTVVSMDLSELQVLAPQGSQKALAYDHGKMSVINCTGGDPDARIYVLMARLKNKDKQVKILMEPNDKLLEAMHESCPDRVIIE